MTTRRALALAVMALDDVARRAPDVAEWREAASMVRAWLREAQGEDGREPPSHLRGAAGDVRSEGGEGVAPALI